MRLCSTRQGRLIVGSNLPVFGDVVGPVAEHYPLDTMRPGDIYWFNDCYASKGAVSHSPDQVFLAPVFADGKLSAFAQSWAHFNDIGGMRPGSLSPDCTDIFQEGIIVPPVRVVREGVVADELLRMFFRNSRFPEMVKGDTRASMAAIRLGERRLAELFQRFGRGVTIGAFDRLIDESEAELRQKLRALVPEGVHAFTDTIDSDGQGHGPIKLRYRLEVGPDRITLDTGASDDQVPGPVNFLMSPPVPAMIFGSYLLGGSSQSILNAGVERVIDETIVRPGSILQPKWPAPLGMRGVTMMRNMATCLGLLNVATGGQAPAAHSAYVIWYLRGRDDNGRAVPDVGRSRRRLRRAPDRRRQRRRLSRGAGELPLRVPRLRLSRARHALCHQPRHRRARALARRLRPRARARGAGAGGHGLHAHRQRRRIRPGASPAAMRPVPGRCVVNPGRPDERIMPPLSDGNIVKRGDIVRVETGGGGGWGHPFDREPERVLADVRGGFVGRDSAEQNYGVVLTADGTGIDLAATERRRAQRPEAKLFHRHGYHEALA